MIYGQAFFDLQLEFAEAVSVLSGLPVTHTALEYTNFYIRFGLGRDFAPTHPTWQEYLAGLRGTDAAGRRHWTYRFYATRPHAAIPPGVVATFGCFSYARLDGDRLRLHFQNAETDGRSPLGRDRRDQRLAELAALFAHVKRTVVHPVRMVGTSWLDNLDAYCRLFPEAYVAGARAVHRRFRHMPLWGQFVDRHGEVKESMAREFRSRLGRQSSVEGLDQCFPVPALSVESPVGEFYTFYGV